MLQMPVSILIKATDADIPDALPLHVDLQGKSGREIL
jgi:hypothetical protein